MERLLLPDCSALIATALDEDFAYGPDYTSLATVPGENRCTAEFTAREAGAIAGLGLIEQVLDATAQRLSQWGVDTGAALADAPSSTAAISINGTGADENKDWVVTVTGESAATRTTTQRLWKAFGQDELPEEVTADIEEFSGKALV